MKIKLYQWCLFALLIGVAFTMQNCQEEELITPLGDELHSASKNAKDKKAYFEVLDTNFENALIILGIDDELDGYVLKTNAKYVTSLDVQDLNISDLTGIEYFKSLKTLNCSMNSLTSLDISKNKTLEYLDCFWNPLTSLDVSKNTALEYQCRARKISIWRHRGLPRETRRCSSSSRPMERCASRRSTSCWTTCVRRMSPTCCC